MVANLPGNPMPTTNAQGAFVTQSDGLVQGQVYPEPAKVYQLASGVLAATETQPMFAGVGIYTNIPQGGAGNPEARLGYGIGRATSSSNLNGFSVWNYAGNVSTASPVPLTPSQGQVSFYFLGSGQRIALQASPGILGLKGGATTQKVGWDYTNQMLVPYVSTTISSATVYQGGALTGTGTYNNATGAVSVTATNPHGLLPGDPFTLAVTAGTGAYASLAGNWIAGTGTTGSTLDFLAPAGLGATTITTGSLTTNAVDIVAAASPSLNPGDTFIISGATGTNSYAALNGEQTAALTTSGTAVRFLTNAVLTASTTLTGGNLSNAAINVQILDIKAANCIVVQYDVSTGQYVWNYNGSAAVVRI